jgi:hypothetical protein
MSEASSFNPLGTGSNPLRMKCDAAQLIVSVRNALLAKIMQVATLA